MSAYVIARIKWRSMEEYERYLTGFRHKAAETNLVMMEGLD